MQLGVRSRQAIYPGQVGSFGSVEKVAFIRTEMLFQKQFILRLLDHQVTAPIGAIDEQARESRAGCGHTDSTHKAIGNILAHKRRIACEVMQVQFLNALAFLFVIKLTKVNPEGLFSARETIVRIMTFEANGNGCGQGIAVDNHTRWQYPFLRSL